MAYDTCIYEVMKKKKVTGWDDLGLSRRWFASMVMQQWIKYDAM